MRFAHDRGGHQRADELRSFFRRRGALELDPRSRATKDIGGLRPGEEGVRINRINQVELKSSRAEQLKNEALTLAVNNAKQKGKALAAAFDAQLGKIYSINSTSEHHLYRYGQNSDIERISVTGSRLSQPAQPGKYLQENIVFSASINVVFDLTVE